MHMLFVLPLFCCMCNLATLQPFMRRTPACCLLKSLITPRSAFVFFLALACQHSQLAHSAVTTVNHTHATAWRSRRWGVDHGLCPSLVDQQGPLRLLSCLPLHGLLTGWGTLPVVSVQYSFSLTTFSPSGKLVQIEYALNAVAAGATSLGISATDGVVIATEKKLPSILVDESTVQKIAMLTPNIGVVYSGMGPDYRVLVRKARKTAQAYHRLYNEHIPVAQLVRETAAVMQEFTRECGPPGTCQLCMQQRQPRQPAGQDLDSCKQGAEAAHGHCTNCFRGSAEAQPSHAASVLFAAATKLGVAETHGTCCCVYLRVQSLAV